NVSVAVQDASGNTETSDNATTVTLAINNNPSGGVLTCTGGLGPQTVAAGVANFTGCAITKAGTGYTLTASSNPARTAPANANAFNITAGTATALTFTTQPTSGQNIQATGTGTFNASVAVQDANGNTETGDNATTVTLAIGTNPSAGVLTCTGGLGPKTVTAGVANFTGCAITKTGTGYTLTASSNPARTAPTNANAFNITAGAASTIAVSSGSGQSATVGGAFSSPLVALVTDANGNPVSGATVTFTPPGTGASATIGGGNTASTNASGLATSGTLTANTTAGGPYNISAAATGTNSVNFSETNKAAGISFVQQNSITPAANASSVTPTLTSGVTAGDALVLTIADQSSNSAIVSSVSGGGVTWAKATSTGTTANGDAEIWYGLNSSGTSGSTVITVTLNHSTNVQIANVSEWSGVATTGALDKTNNANNNTASISAGSVTPTVSGELIISDAYLLNGNTTQPAPSNGFTSLAQMPGTTGNYRGYAAYLVDGSTTSISTAWTEPGGAGSWAAAIATFKP
ncbi:MAG: beta strand repeat-containing protein, partial [Acidimicrobiales bacterium]